MSRTAVIDESPPTSSERAGIPTLVWQVMVGLGVVALWELAVIVGVLPPRLLSQPSLVAVELWQMLLGDEFYRSTIYGHIFATFKAVGIGYVAGSILGIVVGFLLAQSRLLATLFEPYILAIAGLPKISLAPLFVLIFGIDLASKVAIVTMMVFVMLFFNTFSGVRQVNTEFIQLGRIMGADRRTVISRIVLPAAIPSVLTGFRMAVPFAMVGAIIGEFIAATEGIGWAILQATAFFDVAGMIAGVLVLLLVTWVLGQAVGLIEHRALRWQA